MTCRGELYDCSWYWGDLDWRWAERLLLLCEDGCFLVRDSRSETHLFTVSYHVQGKVLHTRISLENSRQQLGSQQPFLSIDYRKLTEIIEKSVQQSREGQHEILIHRRGGEAEASRVHLKTPLTKRELLPSLQYLCRFAIRTRCSNSSNLEFELISPIVRDYLRHSKWIIPDLEECEKVLKKRALKTF
ncbi:unnamed protein product [Caenorhabditis angaria]|uniref:SH2 domain-containing protein n=1 Tax=Caenorhabditis angaria TaxID=860376 RepID=A0A9P1MV08_9PELO|nr:unnamed protein product [Caenorhabditis angaria]